MMKNFQHAATLFCYGIPEKVPLSLCLDTPLFCREQPFVLAGKGG